MEQFSFITACVGGYDMEYANKSASMLARNCNIPFKAYCITDRPDQLSKGIEPITPAKNVKGWWNKTLAFSPNMPEGWILVMDIDLIIINDLTPVIDYALENKAQMASYSDAINWMNCKLSSSFMFFKSGSLSHIYDNFINNYDQLENRAGGDQVWLAPQLDNILYLDEKFNNLKKSLKFDLVQKTSTGMQLPMRLPSEVKIIDFHGNPKPHQIKNWPLVKDHWH